MATGKTTGEAFKEFVELAGLGGELKNAHTSPAPSPAPLCDVVRRLAIYYDPERGSFWKPDDRDIWIKISETGIARHLAEAGFDPQKPKGGAISQVGRILNKIQLSMNVEYAGSLAGYRKGITEFAGKRLLILDSPKLIEPVPGDHRIVGTFLYNLLGNEQLTYLHGWLKVSIETQRNQSLRPGQALVLTGEKDCGKSLLQKLITLLLGGRMAKPYLYMSGQTPFNGNLFRAEHLSIEDEQPFTDIRSRRNFGTKIKEITAIDDQNCHFKFRNGLTLPVFWRLTISLNDETENLLMLPPLDDSLEDKLTIFKVQKHPMPMPTATDEERKKFYDTLVSELPAYVDFLLNDWTIPPHLVSQRYGITHYHNPKILERLGELAPETRLLQLIDAEIFKPNAPIPRTAPWEGSGLELENALRTYPSVVHAQAKELFTWPGACGTYLGRLQKSHPKRIFYKRTKREGRRWIVNPPSP